MRSFFSNTVTSWPARASCCAAASPAGPLPTIATFFPVRIFGGCGTTQPSSHPLSMILCSIDLMPTGTSSMLSVHAASHGAGHTRPVNSGKLLVECRTSSAVFQSCRYTRSLKSGMMLLTGQPLLQNGMPQSMQRAACTPACSSFRCRTNSRQCCLRACGASAASSSRWYSMNPVIFPIVCFRVLSGGQALGRCRLVPCAEFLQCAPVFVREHLDEARAHVRASCRAASARAGCRCSGSGFRSVPSAGTRRSRRGARCASSTVSSCWAEGRTDSRSHIAALHFAAKSPCSSNT